MLHVPDLKELTLDSKSAEETAELEELEEKKRKLQKQEEELSKQRVELQQERAALEEKEKALKDKDKGKEESKQFALKIRYLIKELYLVKLLMNPVSNFLIKSPIGRCGSR